MDRQRPPGNSGRTATAASVLSFLGAAAHLLVPLLAFFGIVEVLGHRGSQYAGTYPNWFAPWSFASGGVQIVLAVLLLIGAIKLQRRRPRGITMIAIACVVVIVLDMAKVAVSITLAKDWKYLPHQMDVDTFRPPSEPGIVMTVVFFMFPIVTLVLVLAPATRRWCHQVSP